MSDNSNATNIVLHILRLIPLNPDTNTNTRLGGGDTERHCGGSKERQQVMKDPDTDSGTRR